MHVNYSLQIFGKVRTLTFGGGALQTVRTCADLGKGAQSFLKKVRTSFLDSPQILVNLRAIAHKSGAKGAGWGYGVCT